MRSSVSRWLWIGCFLAVVGFCEAAYLSRNRDAGNDIFHGGVIPRLDIIIPPDSLKVLRDYHQVWRQKRPERIDVKVNIREGARVYTNVAVHLKGSYSYQDIDEKPSLTLNFDKFSPGQTFHGLGKIHLNNSVQDPSYLCEKLARELFNEAGIPATRAGHALVTINGRDVGLYVLLEGWNKQFLKRHFHSTKGNLYDGGSGGDITRALKVDTGANPDDRSDLTNLVKAARMLLPAERKAALERVLDVDRFRTFAALEIFLVHWDGYCAGAPNNYRLYHDVSRGKMVFMPHGMDQLFGGSSSINFSILPPFKGLVANALFSIPEERQRLRERLGELAADQCSAEKLTARVDRLAAQVRPALAGRPERAEFDAMVDNLKSRIRARVENVERQMQQPERMLAFGNDGYARVVNWRFKGGTEWPALGSRMAENGREFMHVRARGERHGSGAWRSMVLLSEGRYEFTGTGRAVGLNPGATNSGVMLRISGERSTKGLSARETWTPLRYEFDVYGISNVELICEFRGAQGTGSFEVSTLRLRKIGPPQPPQDKPEITGADEP